MAQAEAFLALAGELHFGRAAQRLHVSQPRISRLIGALERQVGAPLFERTSRRVALTPLGEQFRAQLQPAYAQMQAALDHARRAARETAGQLRIGFTSTTEGPALSGLITTFEARQPGCQLILHEVPVWDPYTALRAGEIDVLVNWLALDEADLTAGPAIDCQDRMLAIAATHPLARRKTVDVEDLTEQATMTTPFATFPAAMWDAFVPPLTPAGRRVPRVHPVRSMAEVYALVARGLIVHPTVTSLAQKLARDDIILIPLTGLPPIRLGLIWRTAHENARIRAFAATARQLPHASTVFSDDHGSSLASRPWQPKKPPATSTAAFTPPGSAPNSTPPSTRSPTCSTAPTPASTTAGAATPCAAG